MLKIVIFQKVVKNIYDLWQKSALENWLLLWPAEHFSHFYPLLSNEISEYGNNLQKEIEFVGSEFVKIVNLKKNYKNLKDLFQRFGEYFLIPTFEKQFLNKNYQKYSKQSAIFWAIFKFKSIYSDQSWWNCNKLIKNPQQKLQNPSIVDLLPSTRSTLPHTHFCYIHFQNMEIMFQKKSNSSLQKLLKLSI